MMDRFYAHRKIPKRLEEGVAKFLGNGKERQSNSSALSEPKDLKRANARQSLEVARIS